ncbi:uncharacterized protein LOC122393477 [Amphibalanus amphitrite]|uniref:uncharacterized protein LOC122393477 n=1 Tax=Amphibalanus amphitrite TaxID=1232801 RepID=UPI001C9065F7|nr:uncharacterized protein LOC122393477 [Amphibalanus amphitrite]
MPSVEEETSDAAGRAVMEVTPAFDARTIPEFDGTGNVVEWLEQAALLCELRSVSLMAVLPTRLRGGAFAVWSRMPAATRHHLPSVKAKLLRAFAMDPFTAQAEMARRRLHPGETADVYLAALQQLAELMGGLPERAIAITFVNGLPEAAQAAVRDGLGDEFTLEYVLDRARAVLSRTAVTAAPPAAAAAAAAAKSQERFDAELRLWIEEGWLRPYNEQEHGPVRGLIPLMAVTQEAKDKVRPVLDYRELNEHLVAHTAEADVCRDQLRKWRQHGDDVAVIDLKKAFLQLHVAQELWPFQTVIVDGQRHCLTRVGFGLSVASGIMRAVVREVLDQSPEIAKAVLPYADDLLVNETLISAERVTEHFAAYGLSCKPPERVADEAGARMLGLRVRRQSGGDGTLRWSRDGVTPAEPPGVLTRRSIFAWAGQLTSHVPVAGWLRPAAAWLKRAANKVTKDWDSPITDDDLRKQVSDVARRLAECDPARGQWCVSGDSVTVWTDASSIARGVVLSDPTTGEVIEDAAWLRSDSDSDMHINLSELDAALNGMNMAVAWGFKRVILRTDSVTVQRWLTDALTGRARLRTKAQSEMLVRRRVAVFKQLSSEYDLVVTVELVPSAANRADELTRVPKEWIRTGSEQPTGVVAAVRTARPEDIMAVHESVGHQGVRRTWWYARRELGKSVTKSAVRQIVRSCQVCASIDPAPSRWKHGALAVERNWERLAMDVTHFRGKHYLTVIDCGPSRYAMWREIRRSDGSEIVRQLEALFLERGAPAELLMDNATEFKGRELKAFAVRWDVELRYRAAYEPGGNGIIERHHRTIKVMAALLPDG